jgi:hypothetical protein
VEQIVRLGESFRAVVVVRRDTFRRPTGVGRFPDGGKWKYTARRPGERAYVRFGLQHDTVTARFEEGGPRERVFRLTPDGSLVPVGSAR